MKRKGVPYDEVTLSTVIQAAAASGYVDDGIHLLKQAIDDKSRSYDLPLHAFHHLMSACAQQGHVETVDELHAQLVQAGKIPDLFTYAILFDAHGRVGNSSALLKCVDEMVSFNVSICLHRGRMDSTAWEVAQKLTPKYIILPQNCHNLTQKFTFKLFYPKTATTT